MDLKVRKFPKPGRELKFKTQLCENLKKVENAESSIYTDSKGIPTVGIGYALLSKEGCCYEERELWVTDMKAAVGENTLEAAMIDKEEALVFRMLMEIRSILNGWGLAAEKREAELKTDWDNGANARENKWLKDWEKNRKKKLKKRWDAGKRGSSNAATQAEFVREGMEKEKWFEKWKKALLKMRKADWDAKLEKSRAGEAKKIFKSYWGQDSKDRNLKEFPELTIPQMEKLFFKVYEKDKGKFDKRIKSVVKDLNKKLESSNQKKIPDARVMEMLKELKHSKESLALMSLFYNSPELIGPKLTAALINGDRAEAWCQIRYYSNGGDNPDEKPGIAKRRYFEASTFGLYNDPGDVTPEEGAAVLKMYEDHKNKIDAYEKDYGEKIEIANKEYKPPDVVLSLEDSLKPARARKK